MRKRSHARRKSPSIQAQVNRCVLNAIRRSHPILPWWQIGEPRIRPQSVSGRAFHGINTFLGYGGSVDLPRQSSRIK
jgi:hypothetical protein